MVSTPVQLPDAEQVFQERTIEPHQPLCNARSADR